MPFPITSISITSIFNAPYQVLKRKPSLTGNKKDENMTLMHKLLNEHAMRYTIFTIL